MKKAHFITGVFTSPGAAFRAIEQLLQLGIPRSDISIVAAESDSLSSFGIKRGNKMGQGAAIGGGVGGATGALLAGLTAVGVFATGGLGILAAGPIVAALAGAGAGAAAGGVVGGLIGLGVPEHQVKFYENMLEKGNVLVGVQAQDSNKDLVERTLEANGANRAPMEANENDEKGIAAAAVTGAEEGQTRYGLKFLFVDQIKDLYNAEKQLLAFLPRMRDAALNPKLGRAFNDHLEETRGQVAGRLEMVFGDLGMMPEEEKCPAMTGILAEAREMMKKMNPEHPEHDAALICAAQKIEHYEIGTYGCLLAYARRLAMPRAARLLEETLAEERAADFGLTEIAEAEVNEEALVA